MSGGRRLGVHDEAGGSGGWRETGRPGSYAALTARSRRAPARRGAARRGVAHAQRTAGGRHGGGRHREQGHRPDAVRDAQDRRAAPVERLPQARHPVAPRAARGAGPALTGGYQTWWATSATSSSLRCWVSSLMRFPPMDTGEKPHWVDSASRSLPTYRAASSMRAMSSPAGSISGILLDTRPSTTTLSSGTLASGSNEPDRSSSYSSRNTSKFPERAKILSAVNS